MSKSGEASEVTHLVVFVGGCTWSEIAAVRALTTPKRRFVILTTGLITGRSLIGGLKMGWEVEAH